MRTLAAEFLVPGQAAGELCILSAPLSLWGGFDVHTGIVVERTHPECGTPLAGRLLAMKETKGSSSSASALLEAARAGVAPAGIILGRLDPILVVGALVAHDLYAVMIPVVVLPAESWQYLITGVTARLSADTSQLLVG